MKKSNVTCNSCGYPLNGDRKYCKVCGNNLRENNKVSFNILKPSQIVAIVFLGVALIIGFVGLFTNIDQFTIVNGDYTYYETTGVKWFFYDGWKSLLESTSVEALVTNGVQFGFEFASFALAVIGSLLLLIIYIQSLVRRAQYKHTNFCTMKYFKFFALFTLPYVFMISFFRTLTVTTYPTTDTTYNFFRTFGWGVTLVILANIIGFIAACISHIACPHKKEEKAPFALKQLGVAFAILFVMVGFAAATSVTVIRDENCVVVAYSIFDYIYDFIFDKTVPLTVGISFISVAGLALASLIAALAYVFTKNNARKIGYAGALLAFNIAGLVLNYFATYGWIVNAYGEESLEKVSLVSGTFIFTTFLALLALTFAIIYGAIVHKHTAKKATK